MAKLSAEEIYERHVKPLPVAERLRLIEMAVRDLATRPTENEPPKQHDWMSVRGIAPNLLGGEDAQEWVSRSRREADEYREKQWKRKS
ncbi:MAG TPA: hypothetical protein VGX03_33520 [Candidatus Binatia bacterium]|jgi:hypothetical protein|nr:hypothetical protein [Candidatus Binatia bacterium]